MSKSSYYLGQVQDVRFEVEKQIVKALSDNPDLRKRHMSVHGKNILLKTYKQNGYTRVTFEYDGAILTPARVSVEAMIDALENIENNQFVD